MDFQGYFVNFSFHAHFGFAPLAEAPIFFARTDRILNQGIFFEKNAKQLWTELSMRLIQMLQDLLIMSGWPWYGCSCCCPMWLAGLAHPKKNWGVYPPAPSLQEFFCADNFRPFSAEKSGVKERTGKSILRLYSGIERFLGSPLSHSPSKKR